MKSFIFLLIINFLLFSCVQEPVENDLGGYINEEDYQEEFMTLDTDEIEVNLLIDTSFIDLANRLIDLLAENNLPEFFMNIHPNKGCTISPYTFIEKTSVNKTLEGYKSCLDTDKTLFWGDYDGSGEPIDMTIKDYFKTFVYDFNYKTESAEIHINKSLSHSNTLNNMSDIFPNADFIEFYQDGSAEYEGMDWSSLLFYIEKYNNKYYLVAIAHNQWTI